MEIVRNRTVVCRTPQYGMTILCFQFDDSSLLYVRFRQSFVRFVIFFYGSCGFHCLILWFVLPIRTIFMVESVVVVHATLVIPTGCFTYYCGIG
jgi:hypothetical protein